MFIYLPPVHPTLLHQNVKLYEGRDLSCPVHCCTLKGEDSAGTEEGQMKIIIGWANEWLAVEWGKPWGGWKAEGRHTQSAGTLSIIVSTATVITCFLLQPAERLPFLCKKSPGSGENADPYLVGLGWESVFLRILEVTPMLGVPRSGEDEGHDATLWPRLFPGLSVPPCPCPPVGLRWSGARIKEGQNAGLQEGVSHLPTTGTIKKNSPEWVYLRI